MAETYAGYNAVSWTGMFAPAGTPKGAVDRLANEMIAAGKDTKFVELLVKQGGDPLTDGPEKFAAMIAAEMPLWAEAVKIAGLKRQ